MNDLDHLCIIEQKVIEAERPFNSSIKAGKTTYYNIEKLISDNHACLMVVEDQGEIIGTGYAQIQLSRASLQHDNHSYLGFMYVSPQYRGKGVNKRIIDMLISWSHTQGVKDCYLDVYSGNASAIKAYEKIGFKPCLIEMKLSS